MLVGSTQEVCLKSVYSTIYPSTYMNATCVLLLLGWADRTVYIRQPASDFRSWKENDFPGWLQSHIRNGDAAISNVQLTPGYNTVIQRTWVMAAGSNIAFIIAAKPLHGYFWQAIVSCRGTISRYHFLPPNTCFMDRQSTYRIQGST